MSSKFILGTFVALAAAWSWAISPAYAIVDVTYSWRIADQADGFWNFNGGNPLLDKSGNSNNLTLNGGGHTYTTSSASGNGWTPEELTAATIFGETARSANLNGGNGFDMPAGIYGAGDYTFFLAQHRPTSDNNGNFRTLLGTNRFRYQNVGNTLQGAINAPGGSFGGSTPLVNNDWYLIALTYNNTTKALNSYKMTATGVIGGPVLTGSAAGAGGLSDITALRIGNDGLSLIGGPDGFAGQVDFAGFSNSLFDATQLQLLADDFFLGPQVVITPEPGTWTMLGLGAAGLAWRVRRRKVQK